MNIQIFIGKCVGFGFLFLGACTVQHITIEEEPVDGGTIEDAMSVESAVDRLDAQKTEKIRARITELAMGKSTPESALNYKLDAAAQTTIQVGIDQPVNSLNVNGPPNLRATIYWETSGISTTRLVSVGGGTSVTGSAEAVAVKLQDYSNPANIVDVSEVDYKVSVAAVPGSRGSTSTPPTLVPLISEATFVPASAVPPLGGTYTIDIQGTVTVMVPANVGVQSVFVTPGTYKGSAETNDFSTPVTSLFVSQFDVNGNALKVYQARMDDGFVPLSPQASSVVLGNIVPNLGQTTGTSTFTSGLDTVTGVGTAYTTELEVGQLIWLTGDATWTFIEIAEITDDTHLTLVAPYAAASGSGEIKYVQGDGGVGIVTNATLLWGIDG